MQIKNDEIKREKDSMSYHCDSADVKVIATKNPKKHSIEIQVNEANILEQNEGSLPPSNPSNVQEFQGASYQISPNQLPK